MQSKTDNEAEKDRFECSEELKAKKLVIEKRQKRTLSELGKTLAELKNGLYKVERLPED